MSTLSTNAIIPVTGTTVTIGESGDTITCAGTASGFGGGKILQVASTVKLDTFTYNTAAWGDVTGMSVSLTPASGTKVLVTCCFTYGTSSTYNASARLMRDSTEICVGNADGSRPQTTWGGLYSSLSDNHVHNYSMTFLDTHGANGSTAVTYKLQFNSHDGTAGVMYLNRTLNDSNNNVGARGTSTITVMEVGA